MHYIYNKEKLKIKTLNKLNNYIIIGVIIGARIGQILFYDLHYYKNNLIEAFLPIEIDYLPNSQNTVKNITFTGYRGLSSHGATIGLLISIYLYNKKFLKKNILYIYDLTCIPITLGASLIRLGNLFNSEIIGKPSNVPWAFKFSKYIDIYNKSRHPTQIYESIIYFIIFLLLFFIYQKSTKKRKIGCIFTIFLILTWTARFLIEIIKEPQENEFINIYNMNTGQILSIPFIVLGLICLSIINKKKNKM
jgi:prolipoprotein diacylglyceryl transferase